MILGKHNMMNHPNENFLKNLLSLKIQNHENRCKMINIILFYQDLWNLVKERVTPLAANATDEERVAHKELKKKDHKALFMIHQ